MRLLRLAIEAERWDLAAHTIILAAAKTLGGGATADNKKGEGTDATGRREKEEEHGTAAAES